METATTATINTGSHRTIDLLLIGAKDPSKEYCNHYCPHNNTTYKNVCDGDGCIDPTSGWKQNSSAYPWSKVSRRTKNRRIDSHVIEQYGLAGIPLASATISSPAPAARCKLTTMPGAGAGAGTSANTGNGLNNGLPAALLASGWQLVHLPSGPAGAGQYLLDPTSGASYHMKSGRAFPSDDHGIGFGSHAGAGAGAGDIPSTSTPAAAWTPSRGGLGAAAAAGGGGAASAAGSGARDGMHHPAGAGQYLLHPTNGASFPVKDGNAFFSGRGIGFGPHAGTAGAMPSTSTPAAAWTPSRGGLGAAAAAGGGGAASAAGSGARDGMHHPAGAGQYLLHPTNGASFPVKDGNAFFSGRGIGFGPHAGTAGAMPSTSTPAAAWTPSRGGLGAAAAAAGGGGAASAAGSGARDGMHHPAGAGQYLLHPTNGASYHMKDGNAFFSGHGIGFGPHAGTAGAMPSTSTPAAAWTPSRGGLGGGGTAAGAATAAPGSGARDGVKALVPEGWQVIWLAAGPAGPGQYLFDPYGQMAPYVEGGNAFFSGHGLGFSPYGAAAIPSTFGSYVQGKDASSFAPFGSFPNNFSGGGISTPRIPNITSNDGNGGVPSDAPLHPVSGSTVASKKDFDRLTDLLETSINIDKQNQDKSNANWNDFKAFAGHVDNAFVHAEGELDGVAEDQKGMKNDIAKNTSDVAKNTSDIAKLKEFQQKYEASHGKS